MRDKEERVFLSTGLILITFLVWNWLRLAFIVSVGFTMCGELPWFIFPCFLWLSWYLHLVNDVFIILFVQTTMTEYSVYSVCTDNYDRVQCIFCLYRQLWQSTVCILSVQTTMTECSVYSVCTDNYDRVQCVFCLYRQLWQSAVCILFVQTTMIECSVYSAGEVSITGSETTTQWLSMLALSTSADLSKDWNVVTESTRVTFSQQKSWRISISMETHQVL